MLLELLFRFVLVIFAIIGLIWQEFLLTYQGTLFYHAVMTLLIALVPDLISKMTKYNLTIELRSAFLIFIILAQLLGEIFDFFNRFFWWDKMLHFISAFFITLIGYAIVYINAKSGRQQPYRMGLAFASTFAVSFSIGIATIWEIFEYLMDTYWDMNMQKSGLIDTMEDLIFCVIGSLFACYIIVYGKKKDRPHLFALAVDRLVDANTD